MSDGIFAGVRVLDVSHPFGHYCGKLLADLGADVIKIEPPSGDPGRAYQPFKDDKPDPEGSLFFAYYNSGKRGIVLDFGSAADRAVFDRLASEADAIVETPAHGNAGGFQLEYEELSRLNPRLILASVRGYVDSGPYEDYRSGNETIFALSGVMKGVGPPEGPPEAAPGQISFDLAATDAASGIVAALMARDQSGRGQHVTVAAHEVMASEINPRPQNQFDDKRHPGAANPQLAPSGTYDCQDGGVVMFVNLPAHWAGLKELLGQPPSLQGPDWEERSFRQQHADEISSVIKANFATRTMADIVANGQRLHVPCGPVNTIATFANDPHIAERKFFVTVTREGLGTFKMPGAPYKMSEPVWSVQRPAPRLGEHTAAVLGEPARRADSL
ncbi:MAG: CoA transferase, partial [Chloroflexi bacterium]|nr:CoA transferase [Chloroflexota bacterium]